MEWNIHITINCLSVTPSRFVVKVYSSSFLYNRADQQDSGTFLSGFAPLVVSSPNSPSTWQWVKQLLMIPSTVIQYQMKHLI
uniref:Uncharacterized protein n=1 Tax=Arion vulgaris TaxID=1028688 RepID=A0A0B7BAG1_9EUPU